MITNKDSNTMLLVCPFHLTDGSTLECFVTIVSHLDANVHRVSSFWRLFDVGLTMLEWSSRDKIESIFEWEGESGLSPIGVI